MMNLFNLPLLMGGPQGAGAAPATGTEQFLSFAPFILIIGIFYFLIIRPQNKKQKETQRMLSALKKGDRVVTVGGVHGTIQTVKEGSVLLKVDDNVKIEFSRSAISSVISVAKEAKDEKPAPQIEGRKKPRAKKRDEASKDADADAAESAVTDTEGADAESGD